MNEGLGIILIIRLHICGPINRPSHKTELTFVYSIGLTSSCPERFLLSFLTSLHFLSFIKGLLSFFDFTSKRKMESFLGKLSLNYDCCKNRL